MFREDDGGDRPQVVDHQERGQDNRFPRRGIPRIGEPRGTPETGEGGLRQPGQHAVVQGPR